MNGIDEPLNLAGSGYNDLPNPLGVTLATAQCIGYSELKAIYNNWRVYGSKISVTLTPQALTDTVQLAVLPSYNSIISESLATVQQQPFAKSMQVSSSRGSGRPLTNFITQHKLAGVRRQAIEDDLSGKFAANPGNPSVTATWNIFWETPDGVNLATNCTYNVKLTYFVEWFESNAGIFTN